MQVTRVYNSDEDLDQVKARVEEAIGASSSKQIANAAWQLVSDGGTVTAYNSGKIVVQSVSEDWADKVIQVAAAGDSAEDKQEDFVPHIGVDEAGKGDYFGSLVVAAVFVESVKVAKELEKIGVRDSKALSDSTAKDIRSKILKMKLPFTELVIDPVKYNKLYKEYRNVNKLLAWGHAQAIEETLGDKGSNGCTKAVIDQFSVHESRILDALMKNGKKLEIEQRHKGESDIAVAAASIMARGRFLLELEAMGKKWSTKFLKGASREVVAAGKEFYKAHGYDALSQVAKISFKTTLKITSTFDI